MGLDNIEFRGGGGVGDLFLEHNLVKVTYGAGVVN